MPGPKKKQKQKQHHLTALSQGAARPGQQGGRKLENKTKQYAVLSVSGLWAWFRTLTSSKIYY